MERLETFFIGIVDVFAALLPGAATVGVMLLIYDRDLALLDESLGFEQARLAGFVVTAYITGQILNSVGGFLLDPAYDCFYDPNHGWCTNVEWAIDAKHSKWPPVRWCANIFECGAKARWRALSQSVPGDKLRGSVYQRVRAHLQLGVPEAFAAIERLEAEQKFFRTTTVALALVGIVQLVCPPNKISLGWPCLGAAIFLFTRYMHRRRKTINATYMYYSIREVAKDHCDRKIEAKPPV